MSIVKNNYIEATYDNNSLKIGNFNTISRNVKLGKNIVIGNNCTIEGDVIIGDNCIIGNNVTIINNVTIGNNNQIFSGCNIGYPAQHLISNSIEDKYIEIGDANIFRENCTIHLPFKQNKTIIQNNCFIMVNTNIPHDAKIHNNVVISYNVAIGGHCEIFDFVNIGLNATIHQNIKIGAYSLVGMGTEITKNVLPFLTIHNTNTKILKINKIGFERNYRGSIKFNEIENFKLYFAKYNKVPTNLSSEFKEMIKPFK